MDEKIRVTTCDIYIYLPRFTQQAFNMQNMQFHLWIFFLITISGKQLLVDQRHSLSSSPEITHSLLGVFVLSTNNELLWPYTHICIFYIVSFYACHRSNTLFYRRCTMEGEGVTAGSSSSINTFPLEEERRGQCGELPFRTKASFCGLFLCVCAGSFILRQPTLQRK